MTSAWTTFFGLKISASRSSRSSGTLTTPTLRVSAAVAAGLGVAAGQRVEDGRLAAPGKPDDRDLHGGLSSPARGSTTLRSGSPRAKRRRLSQKSSMLRSRTRAARPRRVGRDDDVRQVVEGRCRRQRLVAEGVEHGAADAPLAQRAEQRPFVDEPAAGDVDEPGAGLHRRERRVVDHALGLGRERRGEDDEVRLGEQLAAAPPGRRRAPAAARREVVAVVGAGVVVGRSPRPDGGASRRPGSRRPWRAPPPRGRSSRSPTMPTVTSRSSRPRAAATSARAAARGAAGSRRLTARIIIRTYSAIGRMKTPRALVTTMPRSRAAGVSARSTPDVAEWTQARRGARARSRSNASRAKPAAEHDLDVVERAVGEALDRDG